ncbi:MAG: uroporphyrinogen-III synthase [Usitatibacter sp.]
MSAGRLEGLGVVITRPRAAAEALAAALQLEGARVFVFPSLEIEDLPPSAALEAALARLQQASLAIFVSANAVQKGVPASRRLGPWPARARVAAIGEATAQALRNFGFAAVISPQERHDSEALLALPQLQRANVEGEDVIVFRGEGGREHLREALEARGARVTYAECYRRVRPQADPGPLLDACSRGEIHAVSALSAETLENFVAMIGEADMRGLSGATLVVPHEAIGTYRDALRFARVVVAPHGTEGLAHTLSQLRVTT